MTVLHGVSLTLTFQRYMLSRSSGWLNCYQILSEMSMSIYERMIC
jgi:hypothetical protein